MSTQDEATTNRKQQLLEAAAVLFAENSFYKTTTADVARAVGVTQPYIFHFFKSKEELYLAVLDQAYQKIKHTFATVESKPDRLKETMGKAFYQLLESHRDEILLVMMAFSIPEPAIRDYAREKFNTIYEMVKDRFAQAGYPDAAKQASAFVGQGLSIALAETLNLPKILPWHGLENM